MMSLWTVGASTPGSTSTFVNLGLATSLQVQSNGSGWEIITISANGSSILNGTWTTQALAQSAAEKLTQAFDPASL